VGLIRLAIVMLGDRGAAEDVVQDAFLGLCRHWDGLADRGNALTYVRSAVLNRCRNAMRQRGQRDRHDRQGPGPMASESAEAVALIGEEHQQVLAAIRALPDRQREALVLRFYLGLFRDGRFTPLPALPVSVPVPTGVLIGTYDW
jgi:RNA polymerase sigma factor (sigma-70 family)